MAKHVLIIEAHLHIQTMSALHHFGQRLHCLVYLCVCVFDISEGPKVLGPMRYDFSPKLHPWFKVLKVSKVLRDFKVFIKPEGIFSARFSTAKIPFSRQFAEYTNF